MGYCSKGVPRYVFAVVDAATDVRDITADRAVSTIVDFCYCAVLVHNSSANSSGKIIPHTVDIYRQLALIIKNSPACEGVPPSNRYPLNDHICLFCLWGCRRSLNVKHPVNPTPINNRLVSPVTEDDHVAPNVQIALGRLIFIGSRDGEGEWVICVISGKGDDIFAGFLIGSNYGRTQ